VLNALASKIPTFMGGDADLAPSTKTTIKGEGNFGLPDYTQRNVAFGVREHGMGAILNGMAVHGGIIKPYCATFFVFSDYMRPTIRLAALMGLKNIFVFTHDSVGLGEDGPTHQPVEHLAALRAIPNVLVIRPADANESAAAWKAAMLHQRGPVILVFSRQNTPTLAPDGIMEGVQRGGYTLAEASGGDPQAVIMATGTEVALALKAKALLEAEEIPTRVVSLPCFELFEAQPLAYREEVLLPHLRARVAVEAGIMQGWHPYLGSGQFIGVGRRFGASAPYEVIYENLGLTPQAVQAAVRSQLGK
jgi:transketolase